MFKRIKTRNLIIPLFIIVVLAVVGFVVMSMYTSANESKLLQSSRQEQFEILFKTNTEDMLDAEIRVAKAELDGIVNLIVHDINASYDDIEAVAADMEDGTGTIFKVLINSIMQKDMIVTWYEKVLAVSFRDNEFIPYMNIYEYYKLEQCALDDIIMGKTDKLIYNRKTSKVLSTREFVDLYKHEGGELLQHISIFITSRITNDGDIMGNSDIAENGTPSNNYKLLIIKELNLSELWNGQDSHTMMLTATLMADNLSGELLKNEMRTLMILVLITGLCTIVLVFRFRR